MKPIFVLCLLVIHAFAFGQNEDRTFFGAENALTSLEGDPNTLVYHSVNVITGDYVDMQTDVVLPGIEPLMLQRFYCSSDERDSTFFKAWSFNHDISLYRESTYGNSITIVQRDAFGAEFPFEGDRYRRNAFLGVKPEALHKGVTNTPRGVMSGRYNL